MQPGIVKRSATLILAFPGVRLFAGAGTVMTAPVPGSPGRE